jgi:hypothetical protein
MSQVLHWRSVAAIFWRWRRRREADEDTIERIEGRLLDRQHVLECRAYRVDGGARPRFRRDLTMTDIPKIIRNYLMSLKPVTAKQEDYARLAEIIKRVNIENPQVSELELMNEQILKDDRLAKIFWEDIATFLVSPKAN